MLSGLNFVKPVIYPICSIALGVLSIAQPVGQLTAPSYLMNPLALLQDPLSVELLSGLDRFEARKKLWSDLEETGLAVKKEAHTSRVPRSQRGGENLWLVSNGSSQWSLTGSGHLKQFQKEGSYYAERFEKVGEESEDCIRGVLGIYKHWLSNIKDWCISEQLWWGHRIPVWYVSGKDCEEEYIVARSHREALAAQEKKYGKSVEIYQDRMFLIPGFQAHLDGQMTQQRISSSLSSISS
ncbi:hypothetical protein HAX54_044041 [Datura stramonium]|uniref:valine--tRNA ligase n=1 Tax=Datura stramonium TaxID=4076 RepID=A0ABS8SQ61_DATST|nr:hypothetical protein [Datura stramonium]